MKRFVSLLLAVSLAALLMSACSDKKRQVREITVSANDYGADGTDAEDDRHCIQLALNEARDRATEETPVAVTLGEGTYYIERGLTVFSHTRLRLNDNAVIILTGQDGCMLYGGKDAGERYDALTDVTVSGGTWRGSASRTGAKTQLFAFKCASRVTIDGLTMEDSTDHFIMLTGVKDSAVTGCTFRDLIPPVSTEGFTKEAVHIDFLPQGTKRLFPSEDITVENCRFDNVASGVGTHHYGYGRAEKNISVRGCEFNRVQYNCVNAYSMTNLTVSGCTASCCGAFLWCRSTGSTLSGNNINGTGERCISVFDGSAAVIKNNRITNVCGETASGKAIALLCGESSCMIENNDISHVDGVGIRVRGGASMSTVKGNAVSHATASGIFVSGNVACIEGNSVSDCDGILTDSCDCLISSNTVEGCLYGIAIHRGSARVTGNTVADSEKIGIKISGTEEANGSAVIEENTVTGSGESDVSIGKHCADCIVRYNNPANRFKLVYSVHSDVIAIRNGVDPPPIAPFVNCAAEGGRIRLFWQKADDAAEYLVYRYDPKADTFEKLAVTGETYYDTHQLLSDGGADTFLVVSRSAKGTPCVYTYPSNAVRVGGGSPDERVEMLSVGGDADVREGGEACFIARAAGINLRYSWQWMKKGASVWSDWEGMTSRFVRAVADSTWDGMRVRCVVTDCAGDAVYSEPWEVSLKKSASIAIQPEEVNARESDSMMIGVTVSGEKTRCSWYCKKAGSQAWTRMKGYNTLSFITAAKSSWNGAQFRCVVTGSDGEDVASEPIKVTVASTLKIVSEPADVYAEEGETVVFQIKADGSGELRYQWYYRKRGDEDWHSWTGHDTSVTSAPANATWDGMQVKCIVTDAAEESVESRSVAVSIRE